MCFVLVLISDKQNAGDLERAFHHNKNVEIVIVEQVLLMKPPTGLDALFVPFAGAGRWGATPKIHRSEVLPTTPEDQKGGLPPFVVTPPCLDPLDRGGTVGQTKLLINSVFEAIRAFNLSGVREIFRVGFFADLLLNPIDQRLEKIRPEELAALFYESVPELSATGGRKL